MSGLVFGGEGCYIRRKEEVGSSHLYFNLSMSVILPDVLKQGKSLHNSQKNVMSLTQHVLSVI